ncbi:MAG: SPOR domain-containing protein, partial [Pseudomonadota bacterium]
PGETDPAEETASAAAVALAAAPTRRPEPEVVAAVEPEPAPAPAPAPATATDSTLSQPFIQVGTFGVPENAARLTERLRAAGLPAEARTSDGGFTRVLVGPAADLETRDGYLAALRDEGFADAIAVGG